jgi:hypothetical protein
MEARIRWFIDGHLYFTLAPGQLPAGSPWVFNSPQFLILNIAVGGNWLVAPAGTAVLRKRVVFRQPAMAAGSAWFDNLSLAEINVAGPPPETLVTVDPQEQWLGYISVSDLPQNGGTCQFGSTHPTADLRAVFNGPVLELYPNSISDPSSYWHVGGGAPGHPGNKIVEASMYVEKTGELSGRTVTFRGTVLSNTLTTAHTGVAYIRDFAPDYSSSNTVTAPLAAGAFSISLDTDPGAGRHVQYGFRMTGPNVWITDGGAFGSVRTAAAGGDPFVTWIDNHDFTGFSDPDLTPSGDPDDDGENNLIEFALDGNPASATATGKKRARIEQIAGNPALVLTLPVREGSFFDGHPAKTAVIDTMAYRIEGSVDLEVFNREVIEIPADPAGMPDLNEGWTYRSFRLADAPGSGATGESSGFLRVRVTQAP